MNDLVSPGGFALHQRLLDATYPLMRTPLGHVLMMKEHRIPWLLLVPERENVEEFHHLSAADRHMLIDDIARITQGLEQEFAPRRINVGDLGNIVGQMHIHIAARATDDPFWPQVVWSRPREPFPSDQDRDNMATRLRRACAGLTQI